MKQLIVNADDFGLTPGVNRAIIEGHTRGIITSTTLMTNMPAFAEAVRLAQTHPTLGVGLHFNITQGGPVAPPELVRSLLNARGEFLGTSTKLAWRALAGHLRREEVMIELRAQIEKATNAGLRLTHVDSHKHAHALPSVLQAIAATIPDYGIRHVRLLREQTRFTASSRQLLQQSIGAFGLSQLCRIGEAQRHRLALSSTTAFFGITQTGHWSKRWLLELIATLPAGASELMCHPGYEDEALNQIQTRLRRTRQVELQLLTDPEIIAAVRAHDVQLINYAQLNRSAEVPSVII
jgi:chitin disaccharide deacetylase